MSDSSKAIVKEFYDSILGGRVAEGIRDLMTADVVWDNPLPESIPFGGKFEGQDGAAEYTKRIFSEIEMEAFEILSIVAEGDHVVLIGSETSLVKSTGRRYTMDWVHEVRLQGGKISYIREYNDTARMLPAFD